MKGKKVLLTGASSGLGKALAFKLASEKAILFITGRNEKKLSAIAKKLRRKTKVEFFACDLSESESCLEIAAIAQKKLGKIDVLINNAGMFQDGDLQDHLEEEVDEMLDVNLRAPILLSRQIVKQMKKRKKGTIVNIISTSSIRPRKEQPVYAATKWGLLGFTNNLRDSLREFGIKVIAIHPGAMKTNHFRNANLKRDKKGYLRPDEVAEIIISSLKTSENAEVGQVVINRMS